MKRPANNNENCYGLCRKKPDFVCASYAFYLIHQLDIERLGILEDRAHGFGLRDPAGFDHDVVVPLALRFRQFHQLVHRYEELLAHGAFTDSDTSKTHMIIEHDSTLTNTIEQGPRCVSARFKAEAGTEAGKISARHHQHNACKTKRLT